MKRTLGVFSLTLALIVVLDLAVTFTLAWAERNWRLSGLVQYIEYGRSVPGKLDKWQANPDAGFNLYDVGWRDAGVARSASEFSNEPKDAGPVVRSYGMSFVNHIIENAVALDPTIAWDGHAGPGVPPNYTYSYFEDDRANRRRGDIVVLGVLASSLPAMVALTNQTWAFEQPAPLTYPIYQPFGEGLIRIDPLVTSAIEQSWLATDANTAQQWHAQLSKQDAYYSMITHRAVVLDASPLACLIRRAAATSHVTKTKAEILRTQSYPYKSVLKRMAIEFARTAHIDGQTPVLILIQDSDAGGVDLLDLMKPVLEREMVKYFATA